MPVPDELDSFGELRDVWAIGGLGWLWWVIVGILQEVNPVCAPVNLRWDWIWVQLHTTRTPTSRNIISHRSLLVPVSAFGGPNKAEVVYKLVIGEPAKHSPTLGNLGTRLEDAYAAQSPITLKFLGVWDAPISSQAATT